MMALLRRSRSFDKWSHARMYFRLPVHIGGVPPEIVRVNERHVTSLSFVFFVLFCLFLFVHVFVCLFVCMCGCACRRDIFDLVNSILPHSQVLCPKPGSSQDAMLK